MAKRKKNKELGITLNESDRLVLFLHRRRELTERLYFKRYFAEPPIELPDEFEEDAFAAFLLTFRHFWSQGEPTELSNIQNTLKHAAHVSKDARLAERLEAIREEFKATNDFGGVVQHDDGTHAMTLTGHQLRCLFINSRYFHNDTEGFQFFLSTS